MMKKTKMNILRNGVRKMPKVTICRGTDYEKMVDWASKQSAVTIDTGFLKQVLSIKNDKLILSIRDNIMIKSLRSKRKVILVGEFKEIEQLERIDEILEAQGNIDGVKYSWKAKEF